MSRTTIETISGLAFDYTAPEVRLQDVAHGLSHVCRFGGHTVRFYSVAEHSVLVGLIVRGIDPELALAALWHDAHEAYMGDLPSPLKGLVGDSYRGIAREIDTAIGAYLGIDPDDLKHPLIKAADNLAVAYEASLLKQGPGWEFSRAMRHDQAEAAMNGEPLGVEPKAARSLFLAAHGRFTND